jgi:Ion channel
MEVLATVGGAALVLVALRDIFDTLFHPHGRGIVSERLIRGIWRATRRLAGTNHSILSFAGPLAFFAVILTWSALVILGFALMLWPHFPDDYVVTEGAGRDDGIGDALYLSMVNLTSLGYGDIVPTATGLRYLGPLETLIGLGLLTASISWILILYRVLSDSRTLSDEIALLSETEREAGVRLNQIAPEAAAGVLSDVTSRLIAVRDDLAHSPIAYYFTPASGGTRSPPSCLA